MDSKKPIPVPYQDSPLYGYYSLYGWRVDPPPNYPQQILDTPYNRKMNACVNGCFSFRDQEKCLMDCHLHTVKTIFDEERSKRIEKFSNVTRSLPSHTSPRYRFSSEELAPFCFYR